MFILYYIILYYIMPIGNTVQCGVYMIDGSHASYPIPYTGSAAELRIPNDVDDNYLVYPGFKVRIMATTSYYDCDNTWGSRPLMYATGNDYNEASNWKVWYMGVEISYGIGYVTQSSVW